MTYKGLILSAVFLLLLFYCGCSIKYTSDSGKEIVLRIEPKEGNPRNSEGDFISLNDGRLLFVYTHFTGGSGDNSKAHLAARFSEDSGKTWTKEDLTIMTNEGGMNIMSVSLIRLNSNKIALYYLRKNSETDCLPIMRISSDEAKTWSKLIVCVEEPGYYVMNNDRVVKLKNGRILLPLALHNTPEINKTFNGRIMCYYSDNDGTSWIKGNEIENPNNVTTQEPGIIELNDNKLMLFCRTNVGVQYFSYSDDYGKTWSELEPSNIKSPLSPASIERIPQTGDLLLVWNKNYKPGANGGKRTPFNIAISKNEGKSWIKSKEIENDPYGWYCYTAIEFIGDHLLLAHCAGDTKHFGGLETTQITRLKLDWLYQESTPAPFLKLNKNGTIELSCDDKDAIIYYSINNKLPSKKINQIYTEPISVNRTTNLSMFAVNKSYASSELVSVYVGEDVFLPALDSLTITGPGLRYNYFQGEFTSTLDIENSISSSESGFASNFLIPDEKVDIKFALIFDGIILIPKDGFYTFYVESNDGSVLFIDDEKLVDNDGSHSANEESVGISLRKGMHKINLKYFQAGGGKILKVSWSGEGIQKNEIPDSVLIR